MFCPFCRYPDSRVTDSRTSDDGSSIRRRRPCPECNMRFSTTETASLTVVKRSGVTQPFSRDRIVAGVRKACQGRPVSEADLALLAQTVEEAVRATGAAQIESNDIGLAILEPLRKLDEVAFMRLGKMVNFDEISKKTNGVLTPEQVYQLFVISSVKATSMAVADKTSGALRLFN